VGAENVSIRVLPLAPEPATVTLAPRRDMDRVQAVSSMLWSAQRGDRTDEVQGDCTGIASLGNPIDVPLRLSVTNSGSTPIEGHFAAGFCDSGARGCVVAPVTGVQSSNLSAVILSQTESPTWNSAAPVSSVSVEASFEGDAGPYTVRQTMNAKRVACRPTRS